MIGALLPYRYRTLVLLVLLAVVSSLDRMCIGVAGPRMQAELGITPVSWAWVAGAFAGGYALFQIPGGVLADRWGPRVALTRAVICWSLFTALTGAVSSIGLLVALRFLFGAAEAGAFPAATSAISRWFPSHERGRTMGVLWMAARLGAMISPLLVLPIQQTWGWRTTFYVFGALGLGWCVVWFGWFRDRPEEKTAITRQELAVIRERRGVPAGHHPVAWGKMIRKASFWKLLATYHAYSWGSFFYLMWLPTILQKGRGFTENDMTFWVALTFALGAGGCLLGGTLSDLLVRRYGLAFGRRVVGTAGLALGAAFLFGAAVTDSKIQAALFLALAYGSMDCFVPVAWATTLDLARRSAGSISGAMNLAGQVGSFLSALAYGYLVTAFGGDYNRTLLPLAAMTAIASLIFSRLDPSVPLVEELSALGAAASRAARDTRHRSV
jgi:ACS family glucarate transporter-like MFS transporter